MSDEPDTERVQERAEDRSQQRSDHVENIIEHTAVLDEHKFPTTSEELATEYAGEPIELANETESLGSVFDRLEGERFETVDEAREAMFGELTGTVGSSYEYNRQRDLEEVKLGTDENVSDSGGSDR